MKKGEPRVDALSKSYGDLEKELAKLKTGKPDHAPENASDYLKDFKMPTERGEGEDKQTLDRVTEFGSDDPLMILFSESAKKHDLNQKQFAGVFEDVMFGMNSMLPEPYDEAAEVAALGGEDKAEALIAINDHWIKRLVSTKTIDQGQADFLMDLAGTAVGIQTLNALRQETGEKPIPVDPAITKGSGRKTRKELQALRNDPRYTSKNEEEKAEYHKYVDQQYIDNDIRV